MESRSSRASSRWPWSVQSTLLVLSILLLSCLPLVTLQADSLAPPAPPSGLVATAASPTQIDLTWVDNSSDETSFVIERSPDDIPGHYAEIATVGANVTTFSDTGLDCGGITYFYRVLTYRTSPSPNYSSPSNSDSADTQACPPPDAPSDLSATAVSQTQIDLAWTDNSDDETNFRIERSLDGITAWGEIGTAAADATSYNDTTLSCGTTYYYRVRAYRSGDGLYSVYSNIANDTTDPCPPPAAPSGLSATAASTTQIDLIWTDNSSDETSFRIERSPDGVGWAEIGFVGSGVTSYNDTGLVCATQYYYRVRAHRSGDNQYSGYSNTDDDTTDACPPDAPSSLTATAVSDSQIDLSWQDNSSDETDFYIERSPDGSTWAPLTSVGADVTTYNDAGLDCGTAYHYRVRAYRSGDGQYSGYSNTANDTTDACPPPDAPSDLNATTFSRNRIDLTWLDNSADETGFHIERSPDGTSAWAEIGSVGAGATSFSDTGLNCETAYYYRVRAYRDSDGLFSGYSNVADDTTGDCLSFYLPFVAADVAPVPPEPPEPPVEECEDLIKNGGFEATGDWEIPTTAHTAGYSTGQAHSGSRSMRVGIVNSANNVYSYSSARQLVTIPADATSATLRFWLYPKSGEATTLASQALAPAHPLARTVEEATLSDDAQYVLVLNEAGTWIDTLLWQKRDDQEWMYHEIDMLDWADKTIKLHFGVFNDGEDGATAMNVDDVELEVCTGGVPPSDCYPILDDTVAVGDAPHGVAINSVNDRLYVANHQGDSLTVIDSTDYTKIRTKAVGDGPNGVAYNPTNNRVYVALRNRNTVKVLRGNGNEILKTIPVGSQPNGVAANHVTNKIFVANFGSGTVSKIDGGTNTVKRTFSVGNEPSMIAVNPNTNKAYVTLHGEGKVAVIDNSTNTVKKVDIFSDGPYGIAVDRVRNQVYVATISTFRIAVIDGDTDTFLGWAEIRRMPGEEPVPLRMIAVNPNIGTSGHIFATTAGADGGWNKFLLLPKGWDEYFARAHALDLNGPREGIAFEPSTDRVFVTARADDLVAAYLDGEPVCDTNFVMSSEYLVTVCVAGPDGNCVETFYR